ncbi:MAG: hypothetical protein JKY44_01735, partial [Flavobacteriaceae bacterium]|nr:hypothetical protein [Flavobacteriaceae bacterium]
MENYTNNYVFKAIDAYPYDLEETMEALNYAVSYEPENTMALTLMGRIYAEKLYNYVEAISYFKEVLAIKIDAFEVYEHYINALLWNEDFKEAEDFIDFALTVKGADKAVLFLKKAALYEQLKEYKKAMIYIKLAKENTFNEDFSILVADQKKRVKDKMPKVKKKKVLKMNEKTKK